MSELISKHAGRSDFERQLLATASALVLVGYIASASVAKAEDTDRPTVWIELGGQMEAVQGNSAPFVAPFMTAISPTPDVYSNSIFLANQRPAKLAFGAEGSLSFQPEGSNWIFSANLRFGRSQTNRHMHKQGPIATDIPYPSYPTFIRYFYAAPFADGKGSNDESHSILDFSAGRDVGIGVVGANGTSVISAGVRIAQFSSSSNVNAMGRPQINLFPSIGFRGVMTFHNYTMVAHAARSFRGIGPSLSWNASAAILGNKDEGELSLDWGFDGAVLFGRQKAKVDHTTQAYHLPTPAAARYPWYQYRYYAKTYEHPHQVTRSRSVAVPNLGGFAGFSVKYPNVKFSVGYRADFFFGAIDAGIDERRAKNLGFSGPFATISIGLGG